MKTIGIIFILILAACAGDIEHDIPPLLNMEVIQIPSQGKVISISGEAALKKKNINGYLNVKVGTVIESEDILWLKKGCITKIEFKDGSYILNEKQAEDAFFTFEMANGAKQPKKLNT